MHRPGDIVALAAVVSLVVALAVPSAVTAATVEQVTEIAVGNATLRIEADPLRIALTDDGGTEMLSTAPARDGAPVRAPGIDGPQPVEPLGEAGAFSGIGFVVGATEGLTFPIAVPFFTGNRLFGAEVGVVISAVRVTDVRRTDDRVELALELDAPGVGPATMVVEPEAAGARIEVAPPEDLPAVASMVTLQSPEDEGLFGLGGRKDAFDQRGLLRNVWVEQQNVGPGPFAPITDNEPTGEVFGETYTFPNGPQATHYPQAVLFGSRGWAAWSDASELQRLDLAHARDDRVRWGWARPSISLSLAGGGLEDAARAYSDRQGRAPAPPRYAYEPWISILNEGEGEAAPFGAEFEGGARVREDVEEVARKAEELDLPIGVIGMEGWHEIPDVEELTTSLRADGFRLAAYWSPFVNQASEVYDEAVANDYLVRSPTGDPYPIVTTRGYVNHLVDFTHPGAARWWGDQMSRSLDLGFEAFMNDFGELVTEGMQFHSGQDPQQVHNLYPALYHQATRQGVDRYRQQHPGTEPFFFVRAGYSAAGDVPGVAASTPSAFPGDETTDDHPAFGLPAIVPMMLNLALGGSYAFTTDVGGYLDLLSPQTDAALLTRWQQAAALMPVSRIHNSTFNGSVMPWDFDEQTLDTYRRFARLKVNLIDLVDAWAQRAAADGTIGPVRPLILHEASERAQQAHDQWLLGTDLLAAPILEVDAEAREVYLPADGDWERVEVTDEGRLRPTGEVSGGGSTITARATLSEMPLFVRVDGDETLPMDTAAKPRPRDDRATEQDRPTGDHLSPPAPSRRPLPATGGSAALGLVALALGATVRWRSRCSLR